MPFKILCSNKVKQTKKSLEMESLFLGHLFLVSVTLTAEAGTQAQPHSGSEAAENRVSLFSFRDRDSGKTRGRRQLLV